VLIESRFLRPVAIIECNFHKAAHARIARRTGSALIRNLSRTLSALLFMIGAWVSGAMAQQKLPNPLTLSQAVDIALANNSIVREARARLDQAAGRSAQSRSTLLPQVEARAR
jgi:outer membrane protein TolC